MDKYRSFRELLSPGWEYRLYSAALCRLEEGGCLPFMNEFGEIEERYKMRRGDELNFRLASKDELSIALKMTFEHFQTKPKNEDRWINFLQTHLCYFDCEGWDPEYDWELGPPKFSPPLGNLSADLREWVETHCYICRTPLTQLALKLTANHIVATFNSLPSISQIMREVERAITIIEISDVHYFQVKRARLKRDAAASGS